MNHHCAVVHFRGFGQYFYRIMPRIEVERRDHFHAERMEDEAVISPKAEQSGITLMRRHFRLRSMLRSNMPVVRPWAKMKPKRI